MITTTGWNLGASLVTLVRWLSTFARAGALMMDLLFLYPFPFFAAFASWTEPETHRTHIPHLFTEHTLLTRFFSPVLWLISPSNALRYAYFHVRNITHTNTRTLLPGSSWRNQPRRRLWTHTSRNLTRACSKPIQLASIPKHPAIFSKLSIHLPRALFLQHRDFITFVCKLCELRRNSDCDLTFARRSSELHPSCDGDLW